MCAYVWQIKEFHLEKFDGGNCEIKLYLYFAVLDLQKENQSEQKKKIYSKQKENVEAQICFGHNNILPQSWCFASVWSAANGKSLIVRHCYTVPSTQYMYRKHRVYLLCLLKCFATLIPVRRFCFRSVSVCRTTCLDATFGARLPPNMQHSVCTFTTSPNAKWSGRHISCRNNETTRLWPDLIQDKYYESIHTFCSVRYWHSSKLKLLLCNKTSRLSDKKNQQISNNKNNHPITIHSS